MGRLGYTQAEALAMDVNAIFLAYEGREEAEHEIITAIYGSQGIPVKPLDRGPKDKRDVAASIRAMVKRPAPKQKV